MDEGIRVGMQRSWHGVLQNGYSGLCHEGGEAGGGAVGGDVGDLSLFSHRAILFPEGLSRTWSRAWLLAL